MRAFLPAVLSLVAVVSTQADWRFDGETGGLYTSNLSNSDRGSDEESDFAWVTRLRANDGFQLTRDLRLTLSADLVGRVWNEYNAFNEIAPGVAGLLRYRFGLGREAPWIAFEQDLRYDAFHEDVRNGWFSTTGLRAGMNFWPRVAVEAGYTFENFAARDDFFDRQTHNIAARVSFDITSAWQVGFEYNYRQGNVISYAVPPRPDILQLTSEKRVVTTFEDNPLYTAYKLSGETRAVAVNTGYALNKYFSVQVGYEYSSTSHSPLRYENHLVEGKVVFTY